MMLKTSLVSLFVSLFLSPCFSQQKSYNEDVNADKHAEYIDGITSFSTTYSMETLDSVIHFEFKDSNPKPNVSKRVFYFDERNFLDSIEERYQDNIFNYNSGYTIRYSYDAPGRVENVFKTSWNSQIEHLHILIRENYNYDISGDFSRFSNIEWRTAHDTSSLDVNEEYAYDVQNQLADYTMFVPLEINPANAIYQESFLYDSLGSLSYESRNLSEDGKSLNLIETKFQNTYIGQNLPWLVNATRRENGLGAWEESANSQFFYDAQDRKSMLTETRTLESVPEYEKQVYSYDDANNVIKEVRYISTDSVQFFLADSILYYHTVQQAEEEEEEEEEEEKEYPDAPEPYDFQLFPNPTDGILHVRSGIDSPSVINIIDASGKIMYSRNVQNGVIDVDLSPYPDGFYFITLASQMGYQTGKVFKF